MHKKRFQFLIQKNPKLLFFVFTVYETYRDRSKKICPKFKASLSLESLILTQQMTDVAYIFTVFKKVDSSEYIQFEIRRSNIKRL